MSYVEAQRWKEYMRKHGALNFGVRVELGAALVCAMIDRALGGKQGVQAFIPSRDAVVDEGYATLEEVMGILSGAQ